MGERRLKIIVSSTGPSLSTLRAESLAHACVARVPRPEMRGGAMRSSEPGDSDSQS